MEASSKRSRSSSEESGERTDSQTPSKRRAPNKLVPKPDADFTCIHEGCSKKCGDKTKWRNHIKNGIHKQAWADLPDAIPKGHSKYKPLPAVEHPQFDARGQPYSKHKLLPTPDADFTCCFAPCTRTLANYQEWRKHITHHRVQFSELPFAKKGFICDEETYPPCCCLKLFKTSEELNKHRGKYVPAASLPSTPPEDKGAWRIFPDAMPHPDDPTKIICHICYESGVVVVYDKLNSLRAHWRSPKFHPGLFESFPLKAGTDIRTYLCTPDTNPSCACGRSFTHKQKWDSHCGATYPCSRGCGAIFSNTSDRGKHENKHCASLEDSYPCGLDGCGHVSPTPGALELHQRGPVHVAPDRVYTCSRVCADGSPCLYRHQHPSKVEQHERVIHGEDRPFICDHADGDEVCAAAFKTNGDLRKHQGVHVTTYDLPCLECDAMFKTARLRSLHTKTVHGELRFSCSDCSACFRVKVARDQHQLTHSEERMFLCDICGDTFRQKTVLDNHISYVHSLDRPHECTCCQMVFTSPTRLASHERIHTEGYRYGKSEAEASIHDILAESKLGGTGVDKFFGEFSPIGVRFVFDFAVNDNRLLEYDGMFHFHPVYKTTRGKEIFLTQVQSDIRKSRFCRANNIPLLRLSGSLPDGPDVVRAILEATVGPHDFSDYVMGHTYFGDFPEFLKLQHPTPAGKLTLSAASELVAEVTVLGDLKTVRDEPIEFDQYHAAILTIFLRENYRCTVDGIQAQFGDAVVLACQIIASLMPELGGVCVAPPLPPVPAVAVERVVVEQMAVAPKIIQTRDSVAYCWLCPKTHEVSFTMCGRGADSLLGHINIVHRLSNGLMPYPVKCEWCPSVFVNHAKRTEERLASEHDVSCTRPLRDPTKNDAAKIWKMVKKNSRCGLCDVVFGTTHRLLRHFNDKHGAEFSHWMTIVCPYGCPSGRFESVKALEEHKCAYI